MGHLVDIEHVSDAVWGVEVSGVVHHVLGEPFEYLRVGKRELLHEVSGQDGSADIADVAVELRDVGVGVRPRQAVAPYVVVAAIVDMLFAPEVLAVLREAEGQDVDLLRRTVNSATRS